MIGKLKEILKRIFKNMYDEKDQQEMIQNYKKYTDGSVKIIQNAAKKFKTTENAAKMGIKKISDWVVRKTDKAAQRLESEINLAEDQRVLVGAEIEKAKELEAQGLKPAGYHSGLKAKLDPVENKLVRRIFSLVKLQQRLQAPGDKLREFRKNKELNARAQNILEDNKQLIDDSASRVLSEVNQMDEDHRRKIKEEKEADQAVRDTSETPIPQKPEEIVTPPVSPVEVKPKEQRVENTPVSPVNAPVSPDTGIDKPIVSDEEKDSSMELHQMFEPINKLFKKEKLEKQGLINDNADMKRQINEITLSITSLKEETASQLAEISKEIKSLKKENTELRAENERLRLEREQFGPLMEKAQQFISFGNELQVLMTGQQVTPEGRALEK